MNFTIGKSVPFTETLQFAGFAVSLNRRKRSTVTLCLGLGPGSPRRCFL